MSPSLVIAVPLDAAGERFPDVSDPESAAGVDPFRQLPLVPVSSHSAELSPVEAFVRVEDGPGAKLAGKGVDVDRLTASTVVAPVSRQRGHVPGEPLRSCIP